MLTDVYTYLGAPMAIGVERADECRTGETGMLSLSLLADGAGSSCRLRAGAALGD
jgi:hypothetical protein